MSISINSIILLVALVFVYFLVHWLFVKRTRSSQPYPPGPKPLPLLGNFWDIPTSKAWLTYGKWCKEYNSDIVYLDVGGEGVVVVNTIEAAVELFEKRSHSYSDRPVFPMVEMMGWQFNAGLLPYGNLWRSHRKIFQQGFKKEASATYQPIQAAKVHDMLHGLLHSPDGFVNHYKTVAAAIIMATVYGHDIKPKNDYFVTLSERATLAASENLTPGATAVNTFPVLRYIPSWFPGVRFWRIAKESKLVTRQMQDVPFNFVKKNMASGTGKPSLLADLLTTNSESGSGVDEDIIKGVTATAYAAGSDTTVSAIGSFWYAMIMNPEIQKKAQAELDTVVGTDRLPGYEDRDSLPYLEAIYREVMRWRPVTPLGVPHRSTQDDAYRGYIIPKGATVIPNIWSMTHDEVKYPDPDTFKPERFLDADGNLNEDDTVLTFGFGRRICPGRHMASATVWLVMASVLATFSIEKAKDDNGHDIEIDPEWTGAAISHIQPFRCSLSPRGEEARRLIEEREIMDI